ncbi:hypothetical protein [Pseudorhodobacter ferrugineus]|uniref:hypothetical protein n=1 Tax=Pseudorhodobacter ferrugineus TaxID=77008 RepID=UPI0022B085EB|nr:hypothetical protein [Pseudorhodobacter ferrugineus]
MVRQLVAAGFAPVCFDSNAQALVRRNCGNGICACGHVTDHNSVTSQSRHGRDLPSYSTRYHRP